MLAPNIGLGAAIQKNDGPDFGAASLYDEAALPFVNILRECSFPQDRSLQDVMTRQKRK
jgi:hypothetical protein